MNIDDTIARLEALGDAAYNKNLWEIHATTTLAQNVLAQAQLELDQKEAELENLSILNKDNENAASYWLDQHGTLRDMYDANVGEIEKLKERLRKAAIPVEKQQKWIKNKYPQVWKELNEHGLII